ncbi:MGDG synthase family glycosyltransferase [Streptomyces sp. NBC_01190]|uniref:MGDG synthase family glycosyltransferase n=1 Tax=Streptomyces sp. NBC_01190 TaxID=2903767 RepID=UPI00386CEA45|nr:hypothetical protein OG519_19610 [Streptomyces sp. NBC_01190]
MPPPSPPDAAAPAGAPADMILSSSARGPIVIFSASMGAGHDGAADELGRRLSADGFAVDRSDFLDVLPSRIGPLLAGAYHQLLTRAPSGYQRIYRATEHRRGTGPVVRAVLRSAEAGVLQAIPADTAAVVSTYPGASQVLGALRHRGLLTIPVVTYLTDFSVHGLWVAAGVDMHLAAHPVPAAQATAQGAAGVRTCGPVVGADFRPPTGGQRQAARVRFGTTLFRPPYGVMTTGTHLACRRLGLTPVLWTAWGEDWRARATPRSIRDTVMRDLRSGGTVLLHDSDCTSATGSWRHTLAALPLLLEAWDARGWRTGPLRDHRQA